MNDLHEINFLVAMYAEKDVTSKVLAVCGKYDVILIFPHF